MKIYTKTGDSGTTGLIGGQRVSKNAPRIAAYGDIDEVNALLGMVICESSHSAIKDSLSEIQKTLFTIGAQLASPNANPNIEVVTSKQVDFLERQMDVISTNLPEMRHFILPGGSRTSAWLHLARTVCRRAERSIVALIGQDGESVDHWLLTYVNRLSDYLFVLSRLANQLEGIEDIPWKPEKHK